MNIASSIILHCSALTDSMPCRLRPILSGCLMVTILCLLPTPAQSVTASPQTIHAEATKAISAEAKAQARYTKWTEEKVSIADDVRDMKAMDAWLAFQIKKYAKYIDRQKAVIAELERRKDEARRIRMELEPFLDVTVNALEEFVQQDLPFLTEERQKRLDFLRASLDDYRLSLSEKLRRVFEALYIENEYGRNVSTTTQELIIAGEPSQVSVFRLGRTALYYQTNDGSAAGIWDADLGAWKPLDPAFARILRRAKDMAERKRAVELLALPVGESR